MNAKILSGSTLKIIAMTTMLVDHFGQIILKNGFAINATYEQFSDSQFEALLNMIEICHILGRIAFPIFCFLLVEGFCHTSNIKKYFIDLGIFAIVSEPIYDLSHYRSCFDSSGFVAQNVLFTLLLGLASIFVIRKFHGGMAVSMIVMLASSAIAYVLHFDGMYFGIILIVLFYCLREKYLLKYAAIAFVMFACGLDFTVNGIDSYFVTSLCSLLPIMLYNGRRGLKVKYFFYWFYPGHLFFFYLITVFGVIPYLDM